MLPEKTLGFFPLSSRGAKGHAWPIGVPSWDKPSQSLARLGPDFLRKHCSNPGSALEVLSAAARMLCALPSTQHSIPPTLLAAATLLMAGQLMSSRWKVQGQKGPHWQGA